MRTRMNLPMLAMLAAVSAVVLSAQQRPPQEPPAAFRSSTQTVPVYATVVDKTGRLVSDLEEAQFEILDNGKPRPITVFKSDVQPISVVAMLDTSGSMTLNLDFLKVAAEEFVLRLMPQDRARIGNFSDLIFINPPNFTSNRDELIRILRNDIRFGNPTFLWDAINASMDALSSESGRRVVLIFTDGDDRTSQVATRDSLLDRAQAEDIMIYAIGLQSRLPAIGLVTTPDRGLRKLAEDTGGGFFDLKKTAELGKTFTRVADELHRQYVLGFSPEVLDGLPHKLDVRVKVPGMTARARKSYIADKRK
jgi:Ca-activated chloride channel family protein